MPKSETEMKENMGEVVGFIVRIFAQCIATLLTMGCQEKEERIDTILSNRFLFYLSHFVSKVHLGIFRPMLPIN